MDFLDIELKSNSKAGMEIVPDFLTGKSKDLMIRGNNFYAVWDEENKVWSTDEYRCIYLIDQEIRKYADKVGKTPGISVKYLKNSNNDGKKNKWNRIIKKQAEIYFNEINNKEKENKGNENNINNRMFK